MGGTNNSKSRTRAKKIICALEEAVPVGQRKYFDYWQVPTDHASMIDWVNAITRLGLGWANLLKNNLFDRYKNTLTDLGDDKSLLLLGKIDGKKKRTGLALFSLIGLLETVESYEKKAWQTGKTAV